MIWSVVGCWEWGGGGRSAGSAAHREGRAGLNPSGRPTLCRWSCPSLRQERLRKLPPDQRQKEVEKRQKLQQRRRMARMAKSM